MQRKLWLLGAALALSAAACGAPSEGSVAEEARSTTDDSLYVLVPRVWPSTVVPVCWEETGSAKEKAWVREAVTASWSSVSAATFVGWDECPERFGGVRIHVTDEWPRTVGLGTELAGLHGGMTLNFTFHNWGTSCSADEETRERCIRNIAVHEFGHVLGFAHEQNRPDTPSTCTDQQGEAGSMLVGAWDKTSIMNYCNPTWNNGGKLSPTDVDGVRRMYGFPGWERDARFCVGEGRELVTGDLDGDGRTDLLCRGEAGGEGRVLYANAQGRYVAESKVVDLAFCPATASLLTADVDGDGQDDLVCHDAKAGRLVVAPASRGFSAAAPSELCPGTALLAGDFDGDGKADLLCHDAKAGTVRVALAREGGAFAASAVATVRGCEGSERLLVADVNGDGRADVLCHDASAGEVRIAYTDRSGRVATTTVASATRFCQGESRELLADDLDGDGRADLLCHDRATGEKALALAESKGFGAPWSGPFGRFCASPSTELRAVRLGREGRTDLLCHHRGTGYLWASLTPARATR